VEHLHSRIHGRQDHLQLNGRGAESIKMKQTLQLEWARLKKLIIVASLAL
jgi:hypothetical protein